MREMTDRYVGDPFKGLFGLAHPTDPVYDQPHEGVRAASHRAFQQRVRLLEVSRFGGAEKQKPAKQGALGATLE